MNILVFGAGAVGTYIGGSLAMKGHRVIFVERPEVSEHICQRGLRLEIAGRDYRLDASSTIACTNSLEEALSMAAFEIAIFALKSYDTQAVIQTASPFRASLPPFLCLQNGVENETVLADAFGAEKVIAGSLTSSIGRRGLGYIVLERLRGVGVAAGHALSAQLAAALNAAGLNAQLYSDAASMKWSKMLTNLMGNATSAILDMPPVEIFSHPGLYRVEIQQFREALQVMTSNGLKVVNLPGVPLRWLVRATYFPRSLTQPVILRSVAGGRGGKMPSFHIDLHLGKQKSEVSYLNVAVVRFGGRVGVPTPVNRFLTETLMGLAEGRLPIDAYRRQPERLIEKIEESRESSFEKIGR